MELQRKLNDRDRLLSEYKVGDIPGYKNNFKTTVMIWLNKALLWLIEFKIVFFPFL